MSMRAGTMAAAMILIGFLLPAGAAAQRGPGDGRDGRRPLPWRGFLRVPMAGIRGGYDFSTSSGSLGFDARIPVAPRGGFLVVPSGDLFFTPTAKDWQLNLDGELRPFPLLGLYGGGGGALVHHTFDPAEGRQTKAGWNLFAGLQPQLAPIRPFVETRWTFRGEHYSAFRLVAGVDIPLFRHRRGGWAPPPRRPGGRPPRP